MKHLCDVEKNNILPLFLPPFFRVVRHLGGWHWGVVKMVCWSDTMQMNRIEEWMRVEEQKVFMPKAKRISEDRLVDVVKDHRKEESEVWK